MNATDHLEQLARDLVGDGKSPNLYFVADEGRVHTVTVDGATAYRVWHQLAGRRPRRWCSLEDREHGTLASLEPREQGGGLERQDDYARLTGDRDAPVRVGAYTADDAE